MGALLRKKTAINSPFFGRQSIIEDDIFLGQKWKAKLEDPGKNREGMSERMMRI